MQNNTSCSHCTSVAQDSRLSRVLSWSCLESKTRPRQDRYTQDQDKTRLVYKIQEILSKLKTLENIDELIFYYGHRPKKECFRKMSSPLNITI